MLGLKLDHVSKRGHKSIHIMGKDIHINIDISEMEE